MYGFRTITSFAGLVAALTVLLLAAGCGGTGAGSDSVSTVDTLPSGVPVVHNRPPADRFEESAWRVTEELRIGSALGEGPEVFGDIRGLTVDDRGRIYVLDAQARQVRAFGSGGQHLWSAGREGKGPGEFSQPNGLALGPEGRLWIPDHAAGRYTVLSREGEPVTTHRATFAMYGYLWHGSFAPGGGMVDRTSVYRPGRENRIVLRRFDWSNGSIDTIPGPSPPPGWERPHYRFEHGGRGGVMGVPFAGDFLWRLDRRGHVWIGTSDRYRITKRTLEGDTVRLLTGRLAPVSVTAEERERAEQDVLDFRQRIGGGGEVDLSRIPEHKAPLHGLGFDDRGRLWVQLVPEREETARFDVYDREGRWRASAVTDFPVPRQRTPVIRGGVFHAVVEDSLGVEQVVRARIERR